jgi:hypothetical protein
MLFSSICACLIHRKDDSYYISINNNTKARK